MAAVFQAEEFPQPGGAEDVQRRGHAESDVRLVAQQKGDPRAIYLCYDTRGGPKAGSMRKVPIPILSGWADRLIGPSLLL